MLKVVTVFALSVRRLHAHIMCGFDSQPKHTGSRLNPKREAEHGRLTKPDRGGLGVQSCSKSPDLRSSDRVMFESNISSYYYLCTISD